MFNMALVRYDRGETDGAIEMMENTLNMRRRVLGAGHPDVASSALNLGLWLTDAGEYYVAGALLDEGISIRASAFGEDHPRVSVARVAKANLLIAMDRNSDALELARQARSSLLESLPEDHWLVAYASSAEGAALTQLGSYGEAEPLLLSSLEPLDLAPIPGVVQKHRIRLANLYTGWGKPGEAERFLSGN
jgi:tetratricopeptide (TPR) repeat protein